MKSNYKRLGDYIREVNVRNTELSVNNLLGININKFFMPSVANTVGTDMTKYKIVKNKQFACNRMHVGRDKRLPVALLKQEDDVIVSPAYDVFEIIDKEVLDPEYLMMWFSRQEFDRNAWFYTDADVRGGLNWKDFCDMQLPLPSITKQKEIVKEYNVLVDRISMNNRLIQKLEETAQAIYKQWFVDFEFLNEDGHPYKSSGGEMEFNEELDKEIPQGWEVGPLKSICTKIGSGATPKGGKDSYHDKGVSLIRSLNVYDFIFSSDAIAFIDEEQAKKLKNVTVEENDILLNITGVSVARCCKVPKFILPARVNQHVMIIRPENKYFLSHYLLCLLCYSDNKSKLLGISQSGSTREAITKSEVEDFQILTPDKEVVKCFDEKVRVILEMIEHKILQNEKLLHLKNLMLSKLITLGDSQ
ncbi:restriction endonuclease subunit S [Bacillus cereus]|uniref:restriction endonuclease subunit S n=1 Tax=Bacillus cereus group TaxID=86661 RepID=UPI0024059D3D|nr:restriction endonuclease subunit S [Bacillus cereus]MDF9610998.1 restriction endonuclease subunit S [Bacillus cereus]